MAVMSMLKQEGHSRPPKWLPEAEKDVSLNFTEILSDARMVSLILVS